MSRAGSSRSATSTSARSPPPSTSLRIALAPVVTSANERAVKLLQAPYSGLPAGLAASAGSPDDALAELAVAGQAITVEARTLAHPVSYELASSVRGEGIEDRATMAPLSARRLADMVSLCTRVAAIESWSPPRPSTSASLSRRAGRLGLGTGRVYRIVRELVRRPRPTARSRPTWNRWSSW